MLDPLSIFGVHTITVTIPVQTPRGPTGGTPFTIEGCFVVERSQVVTARTGEHTNTTAQAAIPLDAPTVPEGATVTLPSGRECRVIMIDHADPANLNMPGFRILHLI
ncbi:hypothetical protein [Actinobaculum sp. 352]|uniref:hypothetical protein n=1 Tax=Actinobaculum sp. 352 TaxID=2490946 RepID=UPI000F7F0B20|nr:hypothetical protein [Actinobaculum sp. 352]RTE47894.1 hypothetical protein EKN07_11585 [Actinobaculum sp. 352]